MNAHELIDPGMGYVKFWHYKLDLFAELAVRKTDGDFLMNLGNNLKELDDYRPHAKSMEIISERLCAIANKIGTTTP